MALTGSDPDFVSTKVFVENFEITKSNNGIVAFTSQFRGDGPLAWGAWT